MLVTGLSRVFLRRWYLVALGVLGTLGLGLLAASHEPPQQEMTASVLLLPPKTSYAEGGNPYVGLGGLEAAADVVARGAMTEDMDRNVIAAGGDSYSVERDLRTAAPMLLVTVQASTPDGAKNTLEVITQAIPTVLRDIQVSAGVPAPDHILSTVIAASDQPEVLLKPQIRAVLIAAAAGLVSTLVLTVAIDNVAGRLAVRKNRESARDVNGSLPPQPLEAGQGAAAHRRSTPVVDRESLLPDPLSPP